MTDAQDITLDADTTLHDAAGNPFKFKKGAKLSAAKAARFPALATKGGSVNAGLARPAAEREANRKADEEAGLVEKRMVPGAPENKAEGVPESRSRGGRPERGE